MEKYCSNTWKAIVESLSSDISRGLSEEECSRRRKTYGDNKINLPYINKNAIIFIKEFFRIYILLGLIITVFLFFRNEILMGIISTVILLSNVTVKIGYIYKKQKKIGYLQNLNYTTTTVLRDGIEKIIKSEDLVKGDIVYFSKGSLISADIRVIRANDIKVDEKNITGENFLKDKLESKIDGRISSIGDMKNILFKGSVIKEGDGSGIVIETGDSTQLGRLLAMLAYSNKNKHTLGDKIEKAFGRIILTFVSIAIGLFFVLNSYGQAFEILDLSLFTIQIIPSGIIVLLYAKILKKDLKENGIELINLSTFDLINDIEILFLDKVGSITQEKMVVKKLYSNNIIYEDRDVDYNKDINIRRLIDILLLCNNAIYNVEDDNGRGDLSEIAYLRFAAKKLAYKSVLDGKHKRVFEIPMDSDKRILTTLNKSKKGSRANIKGNLDTVLDRCTHIMIDGLEKEMTDEDIERIKAIDFNFSLEGLTTQGVAYRSFNYNPSQSENIESNLVFVGMVALENPFNENIEEQIKDIKRRGILPVLFTEDNKITATVIGEKLGLIANSSSVISGVELDSLTRDELIEVLSKVKVFSRVNPEIKGKIVGLFTKDNYSVAASGESLGDLPALSLSKVGISKGKAPEIVKKVSDIFIKNNYLKGFLDVFDYSSSITQRVTKTIVTLISLIISQLAVINILPIISGIGDVNYISLGVINILVCIPLFLVILGTDGEVVKNKKYILRTLLWSIFTLISMYEVDSGNNEIFILILGGIIIEHILLTSKISFKILNRETLLFLFTMIIWMITFGILIIINRLTFSLFYIVMYILILIVYFIIELIMKRWQ